MVERFENEYPECRQEAPKGPKSAKIFHSEANGLLSPTDNGETLSPSTSRTPFDDDDNAEDDDTPFAKSISRRGSEISLKSKNLANEEGQVHRLGQKVHQKIWKNEMNKVANAGGGDQALDDLKSKYEAMSGEELKAEFADFDHHDRDDMVEELIKRSQGHR